MIPAEIAAPSIVAPSIVAPSGKTLRRSAARLQQGMTLLEIMIVLAIIALVMGFLVGPAVFNAFNKSKGEIATMAVRQYASSAYPQWTTTTRKACPDKITDLNEYVNDPTAKDPWDNEYQMLCGDQLPAGAKGIGVFSMGPDGKPNTEDDIRSWTQP